MPPVDIADKLESSNNWTVTLTPSKGPDGGKKSAAPAAAPPYAPLEQPQPQQQQAWSPAATGAPNGDGGKSSGLRVRAIRREEVGRN